MPPIVPPPPGAPGARRAYNPYANDLDNPNSIPDFDAVRNPAHYQLLPGVEVVDVRDRLLDKIDAADKCRLTAREVDYWSRAWEYLTRFMDKGGRDDLRKAEQYLHRLNTGDWPQ